MTPDSLRKAAQRARHLEGIADYLDLETDPNEIERLLNEADQMLADITTLARAGETGRCLAGSSTAENLIF